MDPITYYGYRVVFVLLMIAVILLVFVALPLLIVSEIRDYLAWRKLIKAVKGYSNALKGMRDD